VTLESSRKKKSRRKSCWEIQTLPIKRTDLVREGERKRERERERERKRER
jgi:hypothetical protein